MNERPILFSGPMVRAILDGTKTQTRRVVKLDEPLLGPFRLVQQDASGWNFYKNSPMRDDPWAVRCPYGQPGDLLYVRETWHKLFEYPRGHNESIVYRADGHGLLPGARWKPSIHMPKRLARIWLEVTDVRVERVQEITEEDAFAEGIAPGYCCSGFECGCMGLPVDPPSESFADLWDSINGERGFGWDVNPWVWVVTFKRISR